jgi:hypothetical protein
LKRGQIFHFPILSRRLSLSTVTNALIRDLQNVKKWKKSIQCCQLKFFQCSKHKQFLFLNFLINVLFCPPPVSLKWIKCLKPLHIVCSCYLIFSRNGASYVSF